MTRKLFVLLVLMLMTSPFLSAQGNYAVPISAGFSMAIASGLCGLAQSKAIASAVEGMARNPGAAAAIRGALILGIIFIESLALYTLVIVFAKVS